MNKGTRKAIFISAATAAVVVWAANNVDQVNELLGDKGWF